MSETEIQVTESHAASPAIVGHGELTAMVEMARARPRDETLAYEKALATLENFPAFAESATYSFPKGGKTVRGVGVKGARAILTAWGNAISISSIDLRGAERVTKGVYFDAENIIWKSRERVVPRVVKKDRKSYRLSDDEYDQRTLIEASKAERDTILTGIPEYIVGGFFEKCLEIEDRKYEGTPPIERWKKACEWLKSRKISEPVALALLQVADPAQLTNERMTYFSQIVNAIEQGEATVGTVFGEYIEAAKAAAVPTAAAPANVGGATVSEGGAPVPVNVVQSGPAAPAVQAPPPAPAAAPDPTPTPSPAPAEPTAAPTPSSPPSPTPSSPPSSPTSGVPADKPWGF